MEKAYVLSKCDLCKKTGENISLLSANHKEHGWIMVCQDCWIYLYAENRMVSDSGSLSKGPSLTCGSCTRCSFH